MLGLEGSRSARPIAGMIGHDPSSCGPISTHLVISTIAQDSTNAVGFQCSSIFLTGVPATVELDCDPAGVSQSAGEQSHVAQAYLSYLEQDPREPSLSIAARIARELEIPLGALASAVMR
jgi:hypothetical protein